MQLEFVFRRKNAETDWWRTIINVTKTNLTQMCWIELRVRLLDLETILQRTVNSLERLRGVTVSNAGCRCRREEGTHLCNVTMVACMYNSTNYELSYAWYSHPLTSGRSLQQCYSEWRINESLCLEILNIIKFVTSNAQNRTRFQLSR